MDARLFTSPTAVARSVTWLAGLLPLAGCAEAGGPFVPPPRGCAPDASLADSSCQVAGLPPEMACPPGELPLDGGGCQPAGVPPDACADGFEADGRGGCIALLPAQPCPSGQMALPGEIACREVSPCGDGPYGDIPVDADTEFVDGAYAGSDSDGSRAHPWNTIQRAVDAAASGAIVAVAAGRYAESVVISNKVVRLWGRCPRLVEITGTGQEEAALEVVRRGASGTEVRALSLTDPGMGVYASGVQDVVLDRLWVHDTGNYGIAFGMAFGATGGRIVGSLIERAVHASINLYGTEATVEASIVRDTQPDPVSRAGYGILVQPNPDRAARARLTLKTSLLERNQDAAVNIIGSDAAIEASVVRGTRLSAATRAGSGINALDYPEIGRSVLSVRSSVVEENFCGILVAGSDATLETSVIRDTLYAGGDSEGRGLVLELARDTRQRSTLAMRSSLVERGGTLGVFVAGSVALIETSIVRSNGLDVPAYGTIGVIAEDDPETGDRGELTLRTSRIDDNGRVGVAVIGSDAIVESSVVSGTRATGEYPEAVGLLVRGHIESGEAGRVTVRSSLFDQNADISLLVADAEATVETSVLRETAPTSDGAFGDGITVMSRMQQATSMISLTELSSNTRSGLLVVDATVSTSRLRVAKNRFGVVVQGSRSVVTDDVSTIDGNTEQDKIEDGDLPVPDDPLPLP